MKVEPSQLLDVIAEAATEVVEEHSELSQQALMAMKLITQKVKDKLFKFEVADLGLSEEEIDEFLKEDSNE